jgi:hypothetical protein
MGTRREGEATTGGDRKYSLEANRASMRRCPHFDGCDANLCPLDLLWRRRRHVRGEPICRLALMLIKPGAHTGERQGALGREVLQEVSEVIPAIAAKWYPIRWALERAAGRGLKVENLEAAKAEQAGRCQ